MYERCRGVWPERFKHGYAHYDGAFMEEYFFRHWTASRPALPQVTSAADIVLNAGDLQTQTQACITHPAGAEDIAPTTTYQSCQAVGPGSGASSMCNKFVLAIWDVNCVS